MTALQFRVELFKVHLDYFAAVVGHHAMSFAEGSVVVEPANERVGNLVDAFDKIAQGREVGRFVQLEGHLQGVADFIIDKVAGQAFAGCKHTLVHDLVDRTQCGAGAMNV